MDDHEPPAGTPAGQGGHPPEPDAEAEGPITERVRIVGAQTAVEAVQGATQAASGSPPAGAAAQGAVAPGSASAPGSPASASAPAPGPVPGVPAPPPRPAATPVATGDARPAAGTAPADARPAAGTAPAGAPTTAPPSAGLPTPGATGVPAPAPAPAAPAPASASAPAAPAPASASAPATPSPSATPPPSAGPSASAGGSLDEATQAPGPEAGEGAPVAAVPDLPPWTDPPTGQVPAVLDRSAGDSDEDDPWTAALGGAPVWREQAHEWDDVEFDQTLVVDDDTRLGALAAPSGDEGDEHLEAGSPSEAGQTPAGDEAAQPGRGRGRRLGRRPVAEGVGAPTEAGAGRNVPLAIATGLGVAAVALLCFALGSVATLVLSIVVVVSAAAEAYGSLRKGGYRPATLVGLAGTAALMVAVYTKGESAMPLVLAILVVVTMLWYLFGLGHGSVVQGMGATVLVFLWIGVLGSFAALLLAPSLFPHRHGVAFMFGAVAGVVAADVGALAVGRWLGRHPLAPHVSPNKTWEGLVGGAVLAVVVSTFLTGSIHPWDPAKGAVLGLVVAVFAPLGDLCESLVKRELGVKDMGSFLPGHGGLVDRFDALLFVLPATFVLVRLFHLG